MTVLMTPPDTNEIKTVLRDAVSHGTMQKLANLFGVSHSEISRQYDPNNEKKAAIAEAARHFWGLAANDPKAFETIKTYFVMLLDSWSEPVPVSDRGLSDLVADAGEKLNDLYRARLDGRSVAGQRESALEASAKLQQFLTGLGKQMELKPAKSNLQEINGRNRHA